MDLYSFVFRGNLAQQALDGAGRRTAATFDGIEQIDQALSMNLLDEVGLARSTRMSRVYIAITAFENLIRTLVERTLLEEVGANWWEQCISEKIRKRAESRRDEESKRKFHTQRGDRLLDYIDFGDLAPIFINNWSHFEDLINADLEWVKGVFGSIEVTRNIVMHGGTIDQADVHRVGMAIRDWVKQVGS